MNYNLGNKGELNYLKSKELTDLGTKEREANNDLNNVVEVNNLSDSNLGKSEDKLPKVSNESPQDENMDMDEDWDLSADELNSSYLLSPNRYLISGDLEHALENGCNITSPKFSNPDANYKGIYLVAFRVIKFKGENVLVYNNNIFYPSVFTWTLVIFIFDKYKINERRYYNGFNNNLFILDQPILASFAGDVSNMELFKASLLESYKAIEEQREVILTLYSYMRHLCKSHNVVISDTEKMCLLIELALNRKLRAFLNEVTGYSVDWIQDLYADKESKYNILNRCVFIVEDLALLLSSLKSKGLKVNMGPQKLRGSINSIASSLSLLDSDFRYSLYTHKYHSSNLDTSGNNPRFIKKLGVSKFSFTNIHVNLGLVRYCSTKASKDITTLVSKKSMKEDSVIFNSLETFLKKSPVNEKTEISIEKFLLDFSYISLDPNHKDSPINYDLFSGIKIKKLLLDSKEILLGFINNFRARSYNLNTKSVKQNQNVISRYYLGILLKEIKNEELISIMLGRFARIISNYHNFYNNNISTNVFIDISESLIRDYFYSLYIKHKQSLNSPEKYT